MMTLSEVITCTMNTRMDVAYSFNHNHFNDYDTNHNNLNDTVSIFDSVN